MRAVTTLSAADRNPEKEKADMTQPTWNGRIEVDIRDSQPDWTPFLQPEAPDGAPNALYFDSEQITAAQIITQPGFFTLTGDGLCVGRDSGSPVTPDYAAPFPFTGGTIKRVVVDVSSDPYIDHEKEVLAYLTRD